METIVFIVMLFVGLLAYFIPTVVAQRRTHRNILAIFILNLFLGWTLLGWVGALVWACTSPKALR